VFLDASSGIGTSALELDEKGPPRYRGGPDNRLTMVLPCELAGRRAVSARCAFTSPVDHVTERTIVEFDCPALLKTTCFSTQVLKIARDKLTP